MGITQPQFLIVILLVVFAVSAIYVLTNSSTASKYEAAKQSKGMRVDPIGHANLAPARVERIRRLEPVFAEFYPISHEEWLDGFQRDESPENEIMIWEQVASTYTAFLNENKLDAGAR